LAIRTILMHLTGEAGAKSRLDVGIALARRFSSHLDIVFNVRPAVVPAASAGRGAYAHYMDEAIRHAHDMAGEIAHDIQTRCADLSWSWDVVDAEHLAPLRARASTSDLVILPAAPMTYIEDHFRWHLADCLPIDAACPTLVLPKGYEGGGELGRHVLIAWCDCREAARAVKDAMPFLKRAGKVSLLAVDCGGAPEELDVQRIHDFLTRHGIAVEVSRAQSGARHAGKTILEFSASEGCDLIVMGAYGTSRARQVVFGGATRHILRHLVVPVLMSH